MAWGFSAASTAALQVRPLPLEARGPMSVAARFLITSANATRRYIACLIGANTNWALYFETTGTNRAFFQFATGGVNTNVQWTSGFGAGTLHTLVGTYDLANLQLYADTDPTPKATQAETRLQDTGSSQFNIGQFFVTDTSSLDGVLYELAFWPTKCLSGQDAARFGLGYSADMLSVRPAVYFNFKTDNLNARAGRYAIFPSTGAGNFLTTDINFIYDARRVSRPRRFALPPPAATDGVELQAARMAWSQP